MSKFPQMEPRDSRFVEGVGLWRKSSFVPFLTYETLEISLSGYFPIRLSQGSLIKCPSDLETGSWVLESPDKLRNNISDQTQGT